MKKRLDRLARNLDALRRRGYNLRVADGCIHVDGHPVDRDCFEAPRDVLVSFLAARLGPPRREVSHDVPR